MTGNELAAHLESLAALLRLQGDRRINGLTLDVCVGVELVVPSAATERQHRRRKGTGTGPPSVAPGVTPALQKRDARRDKNESESVTEDETDGEPNAPPLHSPSGSGAAFSEILPSSSASGSREEDADDGVTEAAPRSVTERAPSRVTDARIMCPSDLELRPEQRGGLEFITDFHIRAVTIDYRVKYAGNPGELRTREQWIRGLVTAITRSWNNPNERRKPPADEAPSGPRRVAVATSAARLSLGPELPDEAMAKITPARAVAGPRRSREEQVEELRLLAEQERAAGALEAVDA